MAKKMKNNNPRGSTDLHGSFIRAVRLLEYLRKNTDKNNPITQTDLFRAGDDNNNHIFGVRNTLAKNIAALTYAMNTDKHGIKPKEDWRLSYKQFDEFFGSDSEDEMPKGVTGIYFNHIFSEDELTAIINALNTSKAVSKTEAEVIIGKLVENLASKKYKPPKYKLDFSESIDSLSSEDPARLSKNIAVIQKAISDGFRVSFVYNRVYSKLLNPKEKPEPHGSIIRSVSPYYIVCEKGRLFLYSELEDGTFSVFLVDMMSKITPSGKGSSKIPSLPKHKIRGMPEEMTEEFKIRHLYSSYKNDYVTVEFEWNCRDKKTGEFICTALYGAFGNSFKIDGDGKVTVQTSKFGMKIFALQYADHVKVISPDDLVDDIAKSVRGLRDKYL